MVGMLDLRVKTTTPVVLTIAQAAATSKVQPLELSSIVPSAQVASTNPALIWIFPLHAPLAMEVTFWTTALLKPNTTRRTIANVVPPAKNMPRPPRNAPFATLENTKVPTLLQKSRACRVTRGATLQTTDKMLANMLIANFARLEKNLPRPPQNAPFATLENTKVSTLLQMPRVWRVWAGTL